MAFSSVARVLDRLLFGGRWLRGEVSDPAIGGYLTIQMREGGKVVPGSRREGHNIWTLTGREYIVEAIALASVTPTRTRFREDAVRYFGFGEGVQPEVAEVSRLLQPVEYRVGEFLAPAQVPAIFPSSASGTAKTSVRLYREYAENELSLGVNVTLTEFGCFTDGDPTNSNAVGRTTSYAVASTQAPVGYKAFDPFVKTMGRAIEVAYEIRVL